MPDTLKQFLETLSDSAALELWAYIDGKPDLVRALIDVLLESHKSIVY